DVMSQVLKEKAAVGIPVVFSSHQLDLVQRLCDRVGIIRSGQMVAVGAVAELTERATTRLRVTAPHAPPGWVSGIAGVRVLSEQAGSTVLELAEGADDQAVLRTALATGPVTEFAEHRPTLAELFRNVVTEGGSPE
ncbi:MAG: DUF4162 domain-containing protein, partial [Haloechinothrix sp.]